MVFDMPSGSPPQHRDLPRSLKPLTSSILKAGTRDDRQLIPS